MFGVAAVAAHMHRHVFDDAEDRDADFLEHLQSLFRIHQRDVLRRSDDHHAGDRHLLRERQLDISGARRHIDDQVIEIAPVGLRQQLLQCLRDHRSAPHHRLIGVDQQADRAHLQAVVFHRLERAIVDGRRAAADAEHRRLTRAVDVGIEHADLRAFGGKRQCKIGRDGAFADAALSRRPPQRCS